MMLQRLLDFIIEKQLFHSSEKVILAVSGGVDSVALCALFHQQGYNFAVAHCNFQLRGKESEEDMLFVENLARTYDVPFFLKKFDTERTSIERKISIQMVARDLRYEWFYQLAEENNYNYVATAHHNSDVLETLLLNLTRGTGIAGLHGIAPKKGKIIRPLLFASKDEIKRYASDLRLQWREDSSNYSDKYYRNLIRNEVIPLLKKINPSIEKVTADTTERIKGVEDFFYTKLEDLMRAVSTIKGAATYIDMTALSKEPGTEVLLFEILKKFSFSWSDAKMILKAAKGMAGKRFISNTHELVTDRKQLVITSINTFNDSEGFLFEQDLSFTNPHISFTVSTINRDNYTIPSSPTIAALDKDKLSFPLEIRKWRKGDKFKPLGMKGEKKLSDFYIDQKVPLNLKKNMQVIVSKDKIVWVAGFRINDEFKVEAQTRTVYEIKLNSKILINPIVPFN